ncbi:MAG TPA: gamma-glutamyl-gamma-aminobutyrate hydrolase family protein [Candidatus Angelobacter sp.]
MAAPEQNPRENRPRIAIPEPCSYDAAYSGRALPPYLEAVRAAGGEAVVIPLALPPEELAKRITGCSAVLLPGSKADVDPQKFNSARHPQTVTADPERDGADELLLQDAYNLRKPIFGICYGLQSLNVWRTGSLVQHIESKIAHSSKLGNNMVHQIVVEPDSLLEREIGPDSSANVLPSTIAVNSSHHQAAEIVGDGLRVTARCPDDGVIEALEGTQPGHYVLAVQWHPEKSFANDEPSRRLFQAFVEAAREWRVPTEKAAAE